MSVWVIAKPRLRYHDAVDTFFSRLDRISGLSKYFLMKPEYYSRVNYNNHDSVFSDLMRLDDPLLDPKVKDFHEIFRSCSAHSSFAPLVTNRLMTPILPRDLAAAPEGEIRRRLRHRLDRILFNLPKVIGENIKCLIVKPNASDLSLSTKLGLVVADGYTQAASDTIVSKIQHSIQFSEYKIHESGVFSDVITVELGAGSSFGTIMKTLNDCGIQIPNEVERSWFKPETFSDFYTAEVLIPKSVIELLYKSRPNSRSSAVIPFDRIMEALFYTYNIWKDYQIRDSSVGGKVNIETTTIDDIRALEAELLKNYFWKGDVMQGAF